MAIKRCVGKYILYRLKIVTFSIPMGSLGADQTVFNLTLYIELLKADNERFV